MSEVKNKNFEPSRAEGLRRISSFVKRAGKYYTENRNYDLGPANRLNVSELSPYLRLRLINEKELVSAVLSEHSFRDAEKFIQEILWRTYWKGWLEYRPHVWNNYLRDLSEWKSEIQQNSDLHDRYHRAISANTNIDAFDFWVKELISNGYLHNHARMWFASIWIFTLKLPWVLGADFFFQYLFDGDPASNTLSWRWVAGLHTKGKSYIANADNIIRFTGGRFNLKNQLIKQPQVPTFLEEPYRESLDLEESNLTPQNLKNVVVLMTEEDLSPENWNLSSASITGIVALPPNHNTPTISEDAFLFREAAIQETLQRAHLSFSCPVAYFDFAFEENLIAFCKSLNVTHIITPYIPIGPTRARVDCLKQTLNPLKMELTEFSNSWDKTFWPYTRGGFFKLKERIPDLLGSFYSQIGRDLSNDPSPSH